MGARGGRLDGRHHRHPVADRERLAGHPVAHQGASRVRQRLHLQLPRHQLRVGFRVGPAGGGPGGPQTHRLVDRGRLHGRFGRMERRRPDHRQRPRLGDGRHTRSDRAQLPRRSDPVPGAGPQAVLGEGPPRSVGQGSRHAGRRHGDRHAGRMGAAGVLPGQPGPRRPVLVRAQPGERVRRRRRRFVLRPPPRVRQRAARPLRRPRPDGDRDRAVPIAACRERAHR